MRISKLTHQQSNSLIMKVAPRANLLKIKIFSIVRDKKEIKENKRRSKTMLFDTEEEEAKNP